uniref:Uncharacterized protein n=1 Tax=Arundo donax TaxID=35708 RepID=A0A0A9E493_ARUDO
MKTSVLRNLEPKMLGKVRNRAFRCRFVRFGFRFHRRNHDAQLAAYPHRSPRLPVLLAARLRSRPPLLYTPLIATRARLRAVHCLLRSLCARVRSHHSSACRSPREFSRAWAPGARLAL